MSDDSGIHVEVLPVYQAGESAEDAQRFVFSYTVTVHNRTARTVRLLSRYWKITQGSGKVQEVHGKGVVGQQPVIAPGDSFRYTSRAVFESPVGVMEGHYTCQDDASRRPFEVAIAPFRLAMPHRVH